MLFLALAFPPNQLPEHLVSILTTVAVVLGGIYKSGWREALDNREETSCLAVVRKQDLSSRHGILVNDYALAGLGFTASVPD